MNTVPRTHTLKNRLLSVMIAAVAAALGLMLLAGPAAAAGKKCGKLPLSVKLSSHDPTDLLEGAQAWVYVNPNGRVRGAQVKIRRGGKVYAKGRITGRLASGRTAVVRLHQTRNIGRGKYKVTVTTRKAGCRKARTKVRKWGFKTPTLPVKALPFSTKINDNVNSVRFALRPLRRVQVGQVRVTLVNHNGSTVGEQVIPDLNGNQIVAEIPIGGKLSPGKYSVRMVGKEASTGVWRNTSQSFKFVRGGGGAKPVQTTGMQIQKVSVDWYNGNYQGRQIGGFVAPGIGYGEIVCGPGQQWIRFYPSNGAREAAMMSWTYKNWGTYSEKSLREAKYARGTGPDFREGFNKFGPTEKWSTGSFQGIISDRGPIEGPGTRDLAPPTTYDLDWEWDFSNPKNARCHVDATFRTQTDLEDKPLARSVQVVWRGEGNAPANDVDAIDFPGLGQVTATCEAGPTGNRNFNIDSPVGGKIITREGSDDTAVTQKDGPIQVRLPNNGMLFLQLNSGERILISSRWKVNDLDPDKNWCVVAAQIYTP